MAKYTLLQMTQFILSAMDSDEIDSIGDTTEAQQVVDIIQTTYDALASTLQMPEHYDLFELTNSGDATRPTLMYIPDDVEDISWVQYDRAEAGDTKRNLKAVLFMDKVQFFNRMNTLDTANANVYQFNYLVGSQTFDVRGYNNAWPSYYTTVDDDKLIFDNYMVSEESTLTGNRSFCYGKKLQVFTRSDDFTPNFDDQSFILFFNEAKSQCFAELKQIASAATDRRARQAKVHIGAKKTRVPDEPFRDTHAPNYGRK